MIVGSRNKNKIFRLSQKKSLNIVNFYDVRWILKTCYPNHINLYEVK